jgi:hypothetical protein
VRSRGSRFVEQQEFSPQLASPELHRAAAIASAKVVQRTLPNPSPVLRRAYKSKQDIDVRRRTLEE